MSEVLDRARLLSDLGYGHPEAQRAAVAVLVAARLTAEAKTNIAAEKRERCREALAAALVRLCQRCTGRHPDDGRKPVPTAAACECEGCGGSPNRYAMDQVVAGFRRRGYKRLVIVGGSAGVHGAIADLWPADLELRIVPGTEHHNKAAAKANAAWADVVIVWGASELSHKVSLLYTNLTGPDARKVIGCHRRGVEALAERLSEHLE